MPAAETRRHLRGCLRATRNGLSAIAAVAAPRAGGCGRSGGRGLPGHISAAFKPGLFAIARNCCLARHAADAARVPPAEAAHVSGDPATEAAREEELERVRSALERLKPEFSEAVRLYYFAGLSTPEIAALLDIEEGTARSRLARGLAYLRQALT